MKINKSPRALNILNEPIILWLLSVFPLTPKFLLFSFFFFGLYFHNPREALNFFFRNIIIVNTYASNHSQYVTICNFIILFLPSFVSAFWAEDYVKCLSEEHKKFSLFSAFCKLLLKH